MSKDNGGPDSDKIQQARRAAFEAALAQKNSQRQGSGFDALMPEEVRNMWWAFNAALDCVVIELPSERTRWPGFMRETLEDSAHNNCRGLCADAIESTNLGIKVK